MMERCHHRPRRSPRTNTAPFPRRQGSCWYALSCRPCLSIRCLQPGHDGARLRGEILFQLLGGRRAHVSARRGAARRSHRRAEPRLRRPADDLLQHSLRGPHLAGAPLSARRARRHTAEPGYVDAHADFPWLSDAELRVAEAWGLVECLDVGRDSEAGGARLAVLDGGFSMDADYAGFPARIPQWDFDDDDNNVDGEQNPGAARAAASREKNKRGSAARRSSPRTTTATARAR